MNDFEATVIEAASKLNIVIKNAAQTNGKIAEFEAQLSNIEQQIETDWTEMELKAQQLLDQIAATKKSMAADADTVVQTLVQFRNNIESLESQLETAQQETQAEIASFGEEIDDRQSELETFVETATESLSALEETYNGVTEEVEETSFEFQALLQEDFDNAIQELESDLEEGSAGLIDAITADASPSLSAIGTEFETGIDETIESVADAVQELMQESKTASQELMTEVTNICTEYQASFDDEQEAYAEFIEKLSEVFTQEGEAKVDEVLKSGLLESMKDAREQAEKIVELFSRASEKLEEFI